MIDKNKINNDETITRYIFQSNQYKIQKNKVTASAFVPPRNKNTTSVCRVQGLSEKGIWQLGKDEIESKRKIDIKIKARGDVDVVDIFTIGLNIKPETKESHKRHANIIFPTDEVDYSELVADLALKARLVVYPTQQ